MKKIRKSIYPIAIFSLLLIIFLIGISPPREDFFSKVITISLGMKGKEIASILKEEGLIKSKIFFKIIMRIKGVKNKLQAGEYRLDNRMNLWQILDVLEKGKVIFHKFTIPEGFTVEEIAKFLAKEGLANPQEFLKLTQDKELLSQYEIPAENLEGYLFPDTYKISPGITEGKLIKLMLERFKKVTKEFKRKLSGQNLSLHKVITLASLIEKEAVLDKEKFLISGVFHNRLEKGIRLQCDPTIKYILHKSRKNLYYKDLEIDSPYNTYLHKGLPPGPICNPGKVSIAAALLPTSTKYLYFVSKNDGTHKFSSTFNEHLQAKRKYQRVSPGN